MLSAVNASKKKVMRIQFSFEYVYLSSIEQYQTYLHYPQRRRTHRTPQNRIQTRHPSPLRFQRLLVHMHHLPLLKIHPINRDSQNQSINK